MTLKRKENSGCKGIISGISKCCRFDQGLIVFLFRDRADIGYRRTIVLIMVFFIIFDISRKSISFAAFDFKDRTNDNYLSMPVVYAAREIDLKGVKKTAGDYNKKQLSNRMNNHVTGCAISHYKKICPHEPAIAFCVSIELGEVSYSFM